jgi:hypothetical protein
MHLLELVAADFDIDQHRLERAGNGRRCPQNLAEKMERLRMAADGKGADVPDHRPLGIEVGGADQQQAAFVYSRAISSNIFWLAYLAITSASGVVSAMASSNRAAVRRRRRKILSGVKVV